MQKVERKDKETKECDIITMEEAVDKLSNYWKPETIEGMLLDGQTLWTPYSEYKVIADETE